MKLVLQEAGEQGYEAGDVFDLKGSKVVLVGINGAVKFFLIDIRDWETLALPLLVKDVNNITMAELDRMHGYNREDLQYIGKFEIEED
jgi:hypothetical protein